MCKVDSCKGFNCEEFTCKGDACELKSCPTDNKCKTKQGCKNSSSCKKGNAQLVCEGPACAKTKGGQISCSDPSGGPDKCEWKCNALHAGVWTALQLTDCPTNETCLGVDCFDLSCKEKPACPTYIDRGIDVDVDVDVDFESNYFVNISISEDSSSSSTEEYETEQRPVWGRVFQKKQAKQQSRRSRRSRYAQTSTVPGEKKSDLEECMALQICTTSWYTTESLARFENSLPLGNPNSSRNLD